jgi:predicted MFS family arabinose efflux permease
MARAAITAIFFLNGVAFASWYGRVPAIQDELGIGNGALGLALLGAPAGLLIAQPLAGAVAARRGSRRLVAAAPLLLATIVLPAVADGTATLLLALVVVGAANGTLDVTMNIQGLAVERAGGRPILASLHAAFSFGALAGAAGAALAAAAGVDPLPHLAAAAVVAAAAAVVAGRGLLDDRGAAAAGAPRFARPSRRLLGLGAFAFCALLAEGAVFDWSGIYLDDETGAAAGVAPLGLAAFSLAMGCGRLAADRVAERLGQARVGRAGALLAAAGLGLGLASGAPAGAIAGFVVMGLGLSALFPLALRAAGEATAVAAVSTAGYVGFLVGPPVIGLLAEATDLRSALLLVVVLCAAAAVGAGAALTRRGEAFGGPGPTKPFSYRT